MFLVAGLGNPENEGYALNRHNVGFMAADAIVRRHNFLAYKNKFDAKITQGNIDDNQVILIKPQTYMNLSGKAVAKTSQFYKIDCSHIIIIHDDLDLELGKIKVKTGGGHGGHNGLKSIDACLGNQNYTRIRIGIGRPEYSGMVVDYVLGNFSGDDLEIIKQTTENIAENFSVLLEQGANNFMNKLVVKKQPKNKKDDKNLSQSKKELSTKEQIKKEAVEETSIMKNAFAKALAAISKNNDKEME
ncbi:MAG: aminoacyl-tRNA hydrolase [Alphaproteobacteria bacterium]